MVRSLEKNNLDFFVLGTAKAGTTSIYHYFQQHPGICLPYKRKETWFFDSSDFKRGTDNYFNNYFNFTCNGKVLGEVASSYLFVPYVAKRIHDFSPNAKLLAILRNPVDRAFSDWWMLYSRGIEPLKFEDALYENLDQINKGVTFAEPDLWQDHLQNIKKGHLKYRTYLDYGYYDVQLQRYLAINSVTNLKVLLFEDLKDNAKFFSEICKFLDIQFYPLSKEPEIKNVAVPNRFIGQTVSFLAKHNIHKIIPNEVKQKINKLFQLVGRQEKMPQDIRSFLVEHYLEHNLNLASTIQRDLALWNQI